MTHNKEDTMRSYSLGSLRSCRIYIIKSGRVTGGGGIKLPLCFTGCDSDKGY